MNQKSLHLPYLLLSGTVLIVILAVFVVFVPQVQEMQQAQARTAEVQEIIAARRQFIRDVDAKRAQLNQEQQNERLAAIIMPENEAFDDITRILDRSAQSAGVTIANITNNSTQSQRGAAAARSRGQAGSLPEAVVPLSVNVNVVGSYQQVRNFIDAIERSLRLADVTSIQINKDGAVAELVTLQMDIQFYQYVQPPTPSPLTE